MNHSDESNLTHLPFFFTKRHYVLFLGQYTSGFSALKILVLLSC